MAKLWPIYILLVLFAAASSAEDISVQWFSPFFFSPPLANYTQVVLFGRTVPGTTVAVDKANVITENPEFMEKFAKLAKNDVLQASSGDAGYFQLTMTLPQGLVQVPLTLVHDDQTVTYVISLQVSKEKITMSARTAPDDNKIKFWREENRKFIEKKFGLGVTLAEKLKGFRFSPGIGVNYQSISQSLSQGTDLKFQNFDLPSWGVRGTYNQFNWLVNLDYKSQPGKVSSVSAPFRANDPNYNWTSTTLEGGWNIANAYFGERSRFSLLAGLQEHQVPFFRIDYGNQIDTLTLNLTSFSIGPMFVLEMGPLYFFEIYMHYQRNLSATNTSQTDFSVTQKFAFDGSIGLLRRVKAKQYLGLYWLGQWQRYDFSYRDSVSQVDTPGSQNLFYSNLDLRYIWTF